MILAYIDCLISLHLSVIFWSHLIDPIKANCTYVKRANGVQTWSMPCFVIQAIKTQDGIDVTRSCNIEQECKMMQDCKNQSYDVFQSLHIPKPANLRKFFERQTDSKNATALEYLDLQRKHELY